jgi:hypothetical protein
VESARMSSRSLKMVVVGGRRGRGAGDETMTGRGVECGAVT